MEVGQREGDGMEDNMDWLGQNTHIYNNPLTTLAMYSYFRCTLLCAFQNKPNKASK